jgi:hypothetical protein
MATEISGYAHDICVNALTIRWYIPRSRDSFGISFWFNGAVFSRSSPFSNDKNGKSATRGLSKWGQTGSLSHVLRDRLRLGRLAGAEPVACVACGWL